MKTTTAALIALLTIGTVAACPPADGGEGEGEGEEGEGEEGEGEEGEGEEGEGEEGEGEEGEGEEGEGEGEGEDCASAAALEDSGTFFVVSQAALDVDPTGEAPCVSGSAYLLTFALDQANGDGFGPVFDDDGVAVADNGTPGHDGSFGACDGTVRSDDGNGFNCDGIQTCFITCPLCFEDGPTDLAVAARNTSGELSNAECVLP
jgi:hypothetical protein